MNENLINKIGWGASILACTMYISYIDQIMLNLSGQKGSNLLAIITTINCFAWLLYASMKHKKDRPIIVCNVPGVILGAITAITGLVQF